MSKEFYIGWKNEMPSGSKKVLRVLVVGIMLLVLFLAFLAMKFQKPFNNYVYQLGNQTEVTGTLYTSPVPMLVADDGILPDSLSPYILLIGYGKIGVDGILNSIGKEKGSLQNRKATLKGTLIYGDGKTLLELTDNEKAFLNIESVETVGMVNDDEIPTPKTLRGEIIDPKCYFGVMKPGEGKVHKSCAIRCISGGIPPVLRHETGIVDEPYEYYILVGNDGQKINREILPYVAEVVEVDAEVKEFKNWNIAKIDLNQLTISK